MDCHSTKQNQWEIKKKEIKSSAKLSSNRTVN